MAALDEFFATVNSDIDDTLNGIIPASDSEPRRLHEAIRWSIFAGGKRIRPALVYAVGRAFGAADEQLRCTAAAFEMVHTYSLIHDDLPAMDDDDLRRGRATVHKQFDEATAILAGDVLQTLAFRTIADDASLTANIRVEIISLLAWASGTPSGMVSGQQLDLEAEGNSLSIAEIEAIHRQKTGSLISASAVAGAIIGGATATEKEAVKKYADKLGLLFQITDDMLDVTEATATLGKTAGKDIGAKKATYPGLLGIDETRRLASSVHIQSRNDLDGLEKNTGLLRAIADMIISRSR